MITIRMFAAIAAFAGLMALPAAALKGTQTVEKMITTELADGSVQVDFVPASEVAPGDEVVYRLAYLNDGDAPVENMRLVMPVPAETMYVENSAVSEGVELRFSTDGGETFYARGELQVTSDGQARSALAEDITHISWSFIAPLPIAATGDIMFRAIVR